MNSINLQIELEKEFSVDLSDVQFTEAQTVSSVAEIVKKKGGAI
jgi:acyl carrier protein